MQLGGADPDFSAKAELPAVVETGGRVDGGEGGVGLAQKARGVGVVVGANDFGVVRAVTGDVISGFFLTSTLLSNGAFSVSPEASIL